MRSSKNEPKVCESKVKKIVSLLLNHLKNEHASIKEIIVFTLTQSFIVLILNHLIVPLKYRNNGCNQLSQTNLHSTQAVFKDAQAQFVS